MNQAYKDRIALSKARIENEVRNCVKMIAHHKLPDVIAMIHQRCGKGVDPAFITELWKAAQ